MKLRKVEFNKADIEKIPEKERTLLISFAHAANEINVLSKLFKLAIKRPTNEIERQVMNVQGLLLGRLLAGKLFEMNRLLTSAYFGSKLSKKYEQLLGVEAKVALASIKGYFNDNQNSIKRVRDNHSFHYSIEQLPQGYASLTDNIPLDMYIDEANTNTNTMYSFADCIANLAFMESIDAGDHRKAMNRFMKETSDVAGWFNLFVGNCIKIVFTQYLADKFGPTGHKIVEINNAPNWPDVTIPFFIESPANFSFPLKKGGELTWGKGSMDAPDLF